MDDRFGFGANWQGYLSKHFTPERAEIARSWLLNFLRLDSLEGLDFLDIGCGSGLHSLGAWRSGARTVTSFDYDPLSVEATRSLHRAVGEPANWTVFQGSILDADLCARLGNPDIVYSWGVLHHTGDQWTAIANAISMMGPKSRLYIALYTSEQYVDPSPEYWLEVKRRYNRAGSLRKRLMEAAYIWSFICLRDWRNLLRLPALAKAYKADRGMAMIPDVRDWLGGWPMEFSSVLDVFDFAASRGLTLVNIKTGAANSEYLFVPAEMVGELGYTPVPRGYLVAYMTPLLRRIDDIRVLGDVYVFGTARGARILSNALRHGGRSNIAGFIDLENSGELDGVPVLSFADFAATVPKDATIVLSNQYVIENSKRLVENGYLHVHNAHPLVVALAAKHGV